MFDQLLEESIAEGRTITIAMGRDGGEIPPDPVLAARVEVARRLLTDPDLIPGLVTRMGILDGDKDAPWW
jgi:hypothetical protein